jgi:hypothetical protein
MFRRIVLVTASLGVALGALAAPAQAAGSLATPRGVPLCCSA